MCPHLSQSWPCHCVGTDHLWATTTGATWVSGFKISLVSTCAGAGYGKPGELNSQSRWHISAHRSKNVSWKRNCESIATWFLQSELEICRVLLCFREIPGAGYLRSRRNQGIKGLCSTPNYGSGDHSLKVHLCRPSLGTTKSFSN